MNLEKFHTVYFIGIGGIGMSALAYYFKQIGKTVLGYDRTPSGVTLALQDAGIDVFFDKDMRPIKNLSKEDTLVVYTPAISNNQPDMAFFRVHDFTIIKRSEALGAVTSNSYCIAVGGTHGKTTTSAILAHILKTANTPMTAFLGGISSNYNSNYIYNGDKISVVEADEFDRSFLKLRPDIVSISSIDEDHLDIYGNGEALESSFKEFASKVQDKNNVFIRKGLPIDGLTFGIGDGADFSAEKVKIHPDKGFLFDLKTPKKTYSDVEFLGYGSHNLLNAVSAIAMAESIDISEEKLRKGLASFKGVKRRFSYQIKNSDFVYIDDYAHHPLEIDALKNAIKKLYPDRKTTIVFQPHLYSRTRDFMDDFARSLSRFETVILLDIYPAREAPIEGISSEKLLEKITSKNKQLCRKDGLVESLKNFPTEVLLTAGAGDISEEVEKITKALKSHEIY